MNDEVIEIVRYKSITKNPVDIFFDGKRNEELSAIFKKLSTDMYAFTNNSMEYIIWPLE
ncbi:hypothetical protein MADE_000001022505 [Alteromonas mediterranea DE]|uniref:Uncharacterized protein n=1 Tax=Alteromonas mediterranea (strain DSM 17117 / CIP 110805 / LMG 28347 / Deep ecotype) TaxID=1774373 RepID=T2DMB4_ALTMD|nr:hypothetical protein MADE_000001022505 [Alteromonas mediterranea DE]